MTLRQGQCGVGSHCYLLNVEKPEEPKVRAFTMPGGTTHSAQPWPHHGPLCVLQGSALTQTFAADLATLSSFHCFCSCQLSIDGSRKCTGTLTCPFQPASAFTQLGITAPKGLQLWWKNHVYPEQEGKSFALPGILASDRPEMIDPCPLGSYHLP